MMVLWFNLMLVVPEVYFNVFKHCLFRKKVFLSQLKKKTKRKKKQRIVTKREIRESGLKSRKKK